MKACTSCGTESSDLALSCDSCGTAFGTMQPSLRSAASGAVEQTALSADPDLIANRYRLIEQLGKGGAGVVYRAWDTKLEEDIAIKILQQDENADGAEIGRFKREITTARKITHPNVIRIHDFGESARDVFISMEILTGGTLGRRMKAGLTLSDAIHIAVGICDGVQAAHALGIVHRDLKPDNILFDGEGRPKVVDFGLARLQMASTRTVGFSGTPFYMSPEHANGSEVTTRSDVYSLGIVFYQLFTGRLPFTADNFLRLVTMHCSEKPAPLRSIDPAIPAELERVVLRSLEKDPRKRHANAGELAAELQRLTLAKGTGDATLVRANPDLAQSLRMAGPVPMPVQDLTAAPPRPRPPMMIFVAVGVAAFGLAGAGIAALWLGKTGGPPATPTPAAVAVGATATPVETLVPTPEETTAEATTATPLPTPSRVHAATPAPTKKPAKTPTPAPTKVASIASGAVKVTGNSFIEVYVDGAKVGVAPFELDLKPGSHLVRLVSPGPPLKTKTQTITIVAGKRAELFYDVEKNEIAQKR